MVERTPVTQVPRPCFGLEQKPSNPQCPTCEHKADCATVMGSRCNLVPITQAKFNLIPEQLQDVSWTETDEFNQAYAECYDIMFKRRCDATYHVPNIAQIVNAAAKQTGCSLKLFLLTVMWGHKAKSETPFYCAMLTGDAAIRRVTRYRAVVEQQHGAFTAHDIAQFAGESFDQALHEKQLYQAEILAGNWISGYKTRRGGLPYDSFYEACEAQLPDIWLAIEPTYYARLLDWNKNRKGTLVQNKQRSRVAKLTVQLRRQPKTATAAFLARTKILPHAIQHVVQNKGFIYTDFEVSADKTWTEVLLFWSRLGLAMQHYWCHIYLRGNNPTVALHKLELGSMC